MLAWTIYLSLAGALLLALLPKGNNALARGVALAVALGGLLVAAAGFGWPFGHWAWFEFGRHGFFGR